MNIELIGKLLAELQTIVAEWENGAEVAAIDRDIAIDNIKALYSELRFAEIAVAATIAPTPSPTLTPLPTEIEEVQTAQTTHTQDTPLDEPIVTISLDDIVIVDETLTPDEVITPDEVATPKEAITLDETVTPKEVITPKEPEIVTLNEVSTPKEVVTINEETTPKEPKTTSSLFDLESIPIRPKSRRSVILSLYSDGVPPTPPTPPTPSTPPTPPTPPEESSKEYIIEELFIDNDDDDDDDDDDEATTTTNANVATTIITATPTPTPTIADTLTSETPTIADMYTAEQTILSDTAPTGSSINDNYIIAQELFGGDMSAYEDLLLHLDEFDEFDDAMIYVIENLDMNPDCEAAKLLLKLLESKYL